MEYALDLPDTLIAKFNTLGYADPLEGLQDAAKLLLGLGPEAWGTITAESAAKEISPAKYILQRLNEKPQQAVQPTAKRRQSNEARDNQIADEYLSGTVTYPKLAAKYGLSVVRIVQIVAKVRAVRGL